MQQILEYPEINVMYLESPEGLASAEKTFSKLETILGSLKGRKFYGLMFGKPPKEIYWASVAVLTIDSPEKMGLKTYNIPAGKYVQKTLVNWNENKTQIGETFKNLAEQNQVDPSRPSIEFYRSMTELLCRIPVLVK